MKARHSPPLITRRRFIKESTLISAVIGFPTIIPATVLGQDAPSKRINVLQIGCGRIGASMDIPGLLRHPGRAQIIAVCDVDSRRLALGKAQIEKAYAALPGRATTVLTGRDYHEFINRADIDAVSISTPDHWHAQPVLEAALGGKDIYVQKPLTFTIAEGRLIANAVRERQRILQIGSQQRSTEQFHRACQLVRNGVLGKVHTVRIGLPTDPAGGNGAKAPVPGNLDYDRWLGSTPEVYYAEDRVHPQDSIESRPGWLRHNQFTRGMITGWGSHHIDIAHWALGLEYTGPLSVAATCQWPATGSFWNVHGAYHVEMKYPGGVTMIVGDKLPNGIRFEGELGWIWVSRGDARATASDPSSAKPGASPFAVSNLAWLTHDASADKVRLHRSPGWDHHLDWLDAIRDRKDPVTNVETGHRACSACTVAWTGMKLGRPLTWDPTKERFGDAEADALLNLPERAPFGAFHVAEDAGYTTTV